MTHAATPSRRPTDYAEQHGCHDCGRVFQFSEYDDPCRYFCTFRARSRPPCGSVLMGESFWVDMKLPREERSKARARWERWEMGRNVLPWGICSRWKATP